MTNTPAEKAPDKGTITYDLREAVAVFDDEKALETAVDELLLKGLTEEDISLLAGEPTLRAKLGHIYERVEDIEDSPEAPRKGFMSSDSRTEGLAALVGLPVYVAGVGTAAIVATGGGAIVAVIAAVAGASLAAGAVGMAIARAVGRHHAEQMQHQIERGGILLWVRVDEERDRDVLDILRRNGGRDIHVHTVKRTWGVGDAPLYGFNPDPLLERPPGDNE